MPMARRPVYQDPQQLKRLFQGRVFVVLSLVIILIIILLSRLFYLQVFQQKYYGTLSANNSINLVPIAPPRGLIYDRNGIVLAQNTPSYSLDIVPDRVNDINKTVDQLSQILTITPEDKDQFFRELKRKRSFDEVPIKTNLTPVDVAKFSVDQYRFPGVYVRAELIRHYPFANDLVSVLGYIGRINERDLQNVDESEYAATNYIGKVGIEKYFEDVLHGTVGYHQVETDASGREVRTLSETPPIPGNDIYLTIDSPLQEAALSAMKGDRGALVAIQPSSGEVLAMVSTPAYDPNMFVTGIDKKTYQALQNSQDQPLFNRAIRGQFPFGSTIKIFIALELIDGGYTSPDYQIFDPGYFQLTKEGRIWHDHGDHGWVDLERAIEVSCDTYFYIMSLKMGIEPIDKVLKAFGFGDYTGIQMNEELPGLIPSPEWKMKTRQEKWYPGDTLNSSIGQGSMMTTPLQLAAATATLAERGQRYQPTLLLREVSPDGNILTPSPVLLGNITLKPATWQRVINGMVRVIKGKDGTAWRFGRDAQYTVAAKTGTAQVYSLRGEKYVVANVPINLRDNSMFIAFAPVDNPKIAVAVAIQNQPNAPAVARKVMDYYLLAENHLNLPDQDYTPSTLHHSTANIEEMALGETNAGN